MESHQGLKDKPQQHSNTTTLTELMHDDLSPNMRKVCDQMIRIRNHFRHLKQSQDEKEAQNVLVRAVMLLRMDSVFSEADDKVQKASNFITSKFEPDLVTTIITSQRTRIQTTLVGFALVERTYSMIYNPLITKIIAFALSQIENFDGLSLIMRISKLTDSQMSQVNSFFELIRQQLAATQNKDLAYVSYKFFRDMEMLKNTRETFLLKSIEQYQKEPFTPLFGLIYSLIVKYDKIPDSIDPETCNECEMLLISECLKNAKSDNIQEEYMMTLVNRFFMLKDTMIMRSVGRALFFGLQKRTELLKGFIEQLFVFVGCCFSQLDRMKQASEAIAVGRRLFEIDGLRHFFDDIISHTEISAENGISLAGIFAFVYTSVEPIRLLSNARFIYRGISTEYITSNGTEPNTYICIPLPFKLDEKKRILTLKQMTTMVPIPLYMINPKHFKHHNFILECLEKIDTFQPFIQMLLAQCVSHLCTDSSFTAKLTNNMITKMTSNMQPLFNSQEVERMAFAASKIKRIPQIGHFSVLSFNNTEFISYISPIIDMKSNTFTVTIQSLNLERFGGYVGIVSSPMERFLVRWSLVGVPIGREYPSNTFVCPMNRSKTINLIVTPKQRFYQIQSRETPQIKFPVGDAFRVLIGVKRQQYLSIEVDSYPFDNEATNTFTCNAMHTTTNNQTTSQHESSEPSNQFLSHSQYSQHDVNQIHATRTNNYSNKKNDESIYSDLFHDTEEQSTLPSLPSQVESTNGDQQNHETDQQNHETDEQIHETGEHNHETDEQNHETDEQIHENENQQQDNEKGEKMSMWDEWEETDVVPLYKVPQWTKKFVKNIPSKFKRLPNAKIIPRTPSVEYKESVAFHRPPSDIPLHIGFSTAASDWIIEDEIRTCLSNLKEKANTLSVIRIALKDPQRIPFSAISKLVSILCAQLEPFSLQQFLVGEYPFRIDRPCWKLPPHTILINESEMRDCLKSIIECNNFTRMFGIELKKLINDPNTHLIASLNPFHTYYASGTIKEQLTINTRYSIVSANQFSVNIPHFLIINDKEFQSPLISHIPFTATLDIAAYTMDISVFSVSPFTPEWIFGSPFEILVLLKNFAYCCKTVEEQTLARTLSIDLFNSRSPFICYAAPSLIEHLQFMMPSTPIYRNSEYLRKLLVMGSILKHNPNERLMLVYSNEQRIFTSWFAAETAPYFPEFFSSSTNNQNKQSQENGEKNDKSINECHFSEQSETTQNPGIDVTSDVPRSPPRMSLIKLKIPSIDPGALKVDISSYFQFLRMFSHRYTTLCGFPFWEILPHWYRLSGVWMTETKDIIQPIAEKQPDNIMHFSNPSEIEMRIKLTPKCALPIETMIAVSNSSFFDDPTYITGKHIKDIIQTTDADFYLSLVSNDAVWDMFEIELTSNIPMKAKTEEVIDVDVCEIHDPFVRDMTSFALQWTDRDTQSLINILPRSALLLPTFATVESIAKSCELSQRKTQVVVVLKALIIHHFNYLRHNFSPDQPPPPKLVDAMSHIICREDVADEILKNFAVSDKKLMPSIVVNRKAARELMIAGSGSAKMSLVRQLTSIMSHLETEQLQCPQLPWKVKLVNEEAIDAGGPAREILAEMAESIFDPTSKVAVPTPDGREKKCQFVPLMRKKEHEFVFAGIGAYIGMIVRLNLPQELPFAPFVWSFLAGRDVTPHDVLDVDSALREKLKLLRSGKTRCTWTWERWSGDVEAMPSHSKDDVVADDEESVDAYISEYVKLRVSEVMPALRAMRKGLRRNIGFKTHPLLTGPTLSHMAQGSSVITARQIRQVTVVSAGYTSINDPPIQFFFRALDRMTGEQRRLLLKFTTTLTRLPNSNRFRFRIDKLERKEPDKSLPTASTCFNKLHLPAYSNEETCYQKLISAILLCGTMENK